MKKKIFIASGVIAVVGGIGTAVAVSSCDTVCTLEARPSVMVQLRVEKGSAIEAVSADAVWYVVDAHEPAEVDGIDGYAPEPVPARGICANDDCSDWILGFEQPGDYKIWASVCGQTVEGHATVGMTEDGCHVETQTVVLEPFNAAACDEREYAPPTTCTYEARPSVVATTVDAHGHEIAVSAQEVSYLSDSHSAPQEALCIDEACTRWAVGWETAGNHTITATACGDVQSVDVEVGMTADGCHVDTEFVTIPVDGNRCKEGLKIPQEVACDEPPGPAVFISVLEEMDDYVLPFKADSVTYAFGSNQEPARCIDEKCTAWVTGTDPGDYTITVEACGNTYTERASVAATADGCDVQTQFVSVMVPTEECKLAPSDTKVSPNDPVKGPGAVGR